MSLDEEHKEYKPDYGVFANGFSRKFVVLAAEFKPPEGRQQQVPDFIKIGKELRIAWSIVIDWYTWRCCVWDPCAQEPDGNV